MTNKEHYENTLRLLWRTSSFLSGLAMDIKSLSPERAQNCRTFVEALEKEARSIEARGFYDGPFPKSP